MLPLHISLYLLMGVLYYRADSYMTYWPGYQNTDSSWYQLTVVLFWPVRIAYDAYMGIQDHY